MSIVIILDEEYDLGQIVFKLNIDRKDASFTYWDYDEDFKNASESEVRYQVIQKFKYNLTAQQIDAVVNAVLKSLTKN
jgi:membrane-anchored protein YejM (alkaline phosphatase superfamily)